MEDNKNILSTRIKELRTELGLTQEELALKLGLKGKSSIANYESGKITPSDEIKLKMCNIFDCSMDYLMGKSNFKTKEDEIFDFYTSTFSISPKTMNTALGNNIIPTLTYDELCIFDKIIREKNVCRDRGEIFDIGAFCKNNEEFLNKYDVTSVKKVINGYGELLLAEREVWKTALESMKKKNINNIPDVPCSALEFAGYKKEPQYYMCPVYGCISAGTPNWAEECIEGRIPIDPELMNILNPEECFFLRVNGESMNKEISNGAFALIRKQDMVENGEIAVVLVNGDEATLKKFSKQGDLVILEPMSNDPSFSTQVYNKDTEIKVIGKYIGKMEMN